MARDQKLNVVEILRESKSAKRPNQRPIFTQMLADVEANKYDAILCWHPDRLSRNMLESGRIIDMLDEAKLQDLRFHSHQFSNDANGKMLLGMLFVFSKQYSDDLSDKVGRGIQGNLEEGKSSGAPKWGYDRSEVTGLYEPNKHFDAIREAWHMRAAGESYQIVASYLRGKGVQRVTKDVRSPKILRPNVSTVYKIFHDPFYYGVLVQAGQNTDLCELLPNFIPITDRETYNAVQVIGRGHTRRTDTKRIAFYPLRHLVYCAVCGSNRPMTVGKNKNGSGQYVLSYRCDNPDCERKPKSLRAKHIFNSIYETLDKLELTDEAYKRYSAELDGMTDEKIAEIRTDIHSKRGALAHFAHEIDEQTASLAHVPQTSRAYEPVMQRLERLAAERAELEEEIEKLEAKIANPAQIKLSKDEFLNVIKTAADKMRAGSAAEKDTLCRILFLNVAVDNEKVASYLWREPFASLVKATDFSYGRGERI